MDPLEERVRRVTAERIDIAPYNPDWPASFEREKRHLIDCLPAEIIRRIEHFGSTAVPGLPAKPIVDMLVEVSDLGDVQRRIVPVLESQGYDYFWRPTFGDNGEPFYAWFIKRDAVTHVRTHHIHMVERNFETHWDRLLFRDYLIAHPDVALEYARLKRELAQTHARDRIAYTNAKSEFINQVMAEVKSASRRNL